MRNIVGYLLLVLFKEGLLSFDEDVEATELRLVEWRFNTGLEVDGSDAAASSLSFVLLRIDSSASLDAARTAAAPDEIISH